MSYQLLFTRILLVRSIILLKREVGDSQSLHFAENIIEQQQNSYPLLSAYKLTKSSNSSDIIHKSTLRNSIEISYCFSTDYHKLRVGQARLFSGG